MISPDYFANLHKITVLCINQFSNFDILMAKRTSGLCTEKSDCTSAKVDRLVRTLELFKMQNC